MADSIEKSSISVADDDDDAENVARRQAELEFVAAAYTPHEAWCEEEVVRNKGACSTITAVHRRLFAPQASWTLKLLLPHNYPAHTSLQVQGAVVNSDQVETEHRKIAFSAVPRLLKVCRDTAESLQGQEALLGVFSAAEEWLQDEWTRLVTENKANDTGDNTIKTTTESISNPTNKPATILLGRRLIYSHHIIAKRKRADLQQLARDLHMTGYIKIGWPGLIILEGTEADCQEFYDSIRSWSWQYLVVRGEMQETVANLESARRFTSFQEVSDMSTVANHCREVGLEALFRTSMKVYSTENSEDSTVEEEVQLYGVLIHVDHMNNGKAYRKLLRKLALDLGVSILLRQCFPNQDYTKRPTILVGLLGRQEDCSGFLKQWRTRKVDVDSRGKPCLERQMTVLWQGQMESTVGSSECWSDEEDDQNINTTREKLVELAGQVGGEAWAEVCSGLLKTEHVTRSCEV